MCEEGSELEFPSLPRRDAEAIRMSGLSLQGMVGLAAIVDQELRSCVYIDGVECELLWDLVDVTAEQVGRLVEEFTALRDQKWNL